MTTTASETERSEPRVRASTAIGVLGALSVVGTLALWWIGTFPGDSEDEISREVFGNIPDLVVAMFYVLVSAFIGISFWLFAMRARNWERGSWERRTGDFKRRLHRFRQGVSMRTVMEDPAAGVMHSLMYYGFILLFLGTATLELDHLLPAEFKFLVGPVYQGYSLILDLAAVAFLAGVAWAAVRRTWPPW